MAEQDAQNPTGNDAAESGATAGGTGAADSAPNAAGLDALKAATAAIAAAQTMQKAEAAPAAAGGPAPGSVGGPKLSDEEVEKMMMEQLSAAGTPPASTTNASAFSMPDLGKGSAGSRGPTGIDLLGDVNLQVKIELGRTRMLVEDVLRLGEGSVVELDKLAGDPVDVYVNDRPVARGEVLVLNDNFCVRISEIIGNPADKKVG